MSTRPAAALPHGTIPAEVAGWLDGVADPVFIIGGAPGPPRLLHANAAFCRAVGLRQDELLAQGHAPWPADESLRRLRRAVATALRTGTARCRGPDGTRTTAELRRVRWRGRSFCTGTLRAAPDARVAPLARIESAHREDLLRTAMDLEAMAAWRWDRHRDRIAVEYRAAGSRFPRVGTPTLASFTARVRDGDRQRLTAGIRRALAEDGIQHAEFRILDKDGRERWISVAFQRYLDARGRPAGVVGAARDITRRKDFYRELAESESRLRVVLETEPECVKIIDSHGRLQMMNPAGLAMIGADAESQVVGQPAVGLVVPEHRTAYEAFHRRIMAGHTELQEFEIVSLKGKRRWMESKSAPLRNEAGEVVGHLAVARDVTERRAMSREIIEAANREQERIGSELHDGLGQELTGIALMLKGLRGQLERPRHDLGREVDEILRLVNQALRSTRSIAQGLAPTALERGGLAEALRMLVARARETARPRIRLTIRSSAQQHLDRPVRLHLYRIAQEALGNALRHADAKRISIALTRSSSRATLRITDDGRGLPADASAGPGLGQHTMQYRAGLIGASIQFRRPAAGGTAVIVQWPAGPAGKGDR